MEWVCGIFIEYARSSRCFRISCFSNDVGCPHEQRRGLIFRLSSFGRFVAYRQSIGIGLVSALALQRLHREIRLIARATIDPTFLTWNIVLSFCFPPFQVNL